MTHSLIINKNAKINEIEIEDGNIDTINNNGTIGIGTYRSGTVNIGTNANNTTINIGNEEDNIYIKGKLINNDALVPSNKGSHQYYINNNLEDNYTADGSPLYPFKSLMEAHNYVYNKLNNGELKKKNQYGFLLAPGKYNVYDDTNELIWKIPNSSICGQVGSRISGDVYIYSHDGNNFKKIKIIPEYDEDTSPTQDFSIEGGILLRGGDIKPGWLRSNKNKDFFVNIYNSVLHDFTYTANTGWDRIQLYNSWFNNSNITLNGGRISFFNCVSNTNSLTITDEVQDITNTQSMLYSGSKIIYIIINYSSFYDINYDLKNNNGGQYDIFFSYSRAYNINFTEPTPLPISHILLESKVDNLNLNADVKLASEYFFSAGNRGIYKRLDEYKKDIKLLYNKNELEKYTSNTDAKNNGLTEGDLYINTNTGEGLLAIVI